MPKKAFCLEEKPGERFPSLEAAQQLALPYLAGELAATIQSLLGAPSQYRVGH